MPVPPDIESAIKAFPHQPGVYLFKTEAGKPLYIGKAKDLRKRGASYLRLHQLPSGKARMVMNAHHIDHIVVNTEEEALLLENTLIKQHKPRYNVMLKDDKNFRYIRIDWSEDYPRLSTVRRISDSRAHYYGPYVSGGSLNRTLRLLSRAFKVRDCTLNLRDDTPSSFIKRPCLKKDLGRCTAPCVLNELTEEQKYISKEDYTEQVRQLESFLRGDTSELITELSTNMNKASEAKKYEKAADLRDKIRDIGKLLGNPQDVVNVPFKEADIVAIAFGTDEETSATAARMVIRNSSLVARESYTLSREANQTPAEAMEAFLLQFYGSSTQLPKEIFVETLPTNVGILETWLGTRAGSLELDHKNIKISKPARGARRRLTELALTNAREVRQKHTQKESANLAILERTQEALGLDQLPERIECVDVSHVQGSNPVASMVVFTNGQPDKDQYRKFKIKNEEAAPDDTRRMKEVLRRRFTHSTAPHNPDGDAAKTGHGEEWPLPDLLVLDGGKPQLGIGVEVLKELHLESIPIVALAKQEEEIFFPGKSEPLVLPLTDPALRLLTRARDEAHRFAITKNRNKRIKSMRGK